MTTAKLAEISIETGQTLVASHQLTDSGNHQKYGSASKPWSKFAGKEATILPNGLATGGAVVVGVSGTNNKIDVAALTCYLAGILTTVNAAADETVTRAVTTDTHMINSVTITAAGAVAIIAGTDSTAFSEVRDAAGGPPLIPVGSVEIAQIRMSSNAAAKVTTDEIFAVAGQHMERYDYPTWTVDPIAGTIEFSAALPLSHTGAVTKRTFGKVYTPLYEVVPSGRGNAFVPADTTSSVSSTQNYGGVSNAESSSLGQCSFTVELDSGHIDTVIGLARDNQIVLVKFKSDKNKIPYSLTQGRINIKRTNPAGAQMLATVTISSELPTVDFAS